MLMRPTSFAVRCFIVNVFNEWKIIYNKKENKKNIKINSSLIARQQEMMPRAAIRNPGIWHAICIVIRAKRNKNRKYDVHK